MNELTNDELIIRIAKTKASGLPADSYFRLMGLNKSYVYSARKILRNRGMKDEEIEVEVCNKMRVLRSWMDKSPSERDEFVALYSTYLERPKDVSEHQFCNEAGIDVYEFRRLRTGYKYFTDIFEKLDSKDAAATVNTGVNGPIQIIFHRKPSEVKAEIFKDISAKYTKKLEDEGEVSGKEVVTALFNALGSNCEEKILDGTVLDNLTPGTYIPSETTPAVSTEENDDGWNYASRVVHIHMSRYAWEDTDRSFIVDLPYDENNLDHIFTNIARLLHEFMP